VPWLILAWLLLGGAGWLRLYKWGCQLFATEGSVSKTKQWVRVRVEPHPYLAGNKELKPGGMGWAEWNPGSGYVWVDFDDRRAYSVDAKFIRLQLDEEPVAAIPPRGH
jgi:hypothetical protein